MRIAVIDDHPILREGVLNLLRVLDAAYCAEGFDTLEAFDRAAAAQAFDLVLLDLGLPGFAELDALASYRDAHSDIPVVVLSALSDQRTILGALDIGAMGFIPKTSKQETLRQAIKLVASGAVYIPAEAVMLSTLRRIESKSPADDEPKASRRGESRTSVPGLTPRQLDVLNLLIRGLPNKLICRELDLSPNTVKSHVSAIFRALDVSNRTQAVIAAQKLRLRIDYTRKR